MKEYKKKQFRHETAGKRRKLIRYLGFVIDIEKSSFQSLTHALVNLAEDPDVWYIVELVDELYGSSSKDSPGRYFRSIFFLSAGPAMLSNRMTALLLSVPAVTMRWLLLAD